MKYSTSNGISVARSRTEGILTGNIQPVQQILTERLFAYEFVQIAVALGNLEDRAFLTVLEIGGEGGIRNTAGC